MVETVDIDVRQRILTEATRLFAERGVAATSIQRVSDAAGISKPTLVYHFGSKSGLRDAALSRVMDHWQAELPRLMAAAASGGPRIDALLNTMFTFFRGSPELARLVLREMLDRPAEMEALMRHRLQPWTRLLTEAIRHGQQTGLLRPDADPEAFTVLVISTALGVVAIGPHSAAMLSPEPTSDAQQAELVRIARVSLLMPREN